jgi:nucleotide-binding universal stress UspA family protein
MSTFASPHRIVVGIDGCSNAAHAASWAARPAVRRGAQLHLLHAVNLTGAGSLLTRLPFEEYQQNRMKQAEALLDETRAELLGHHPAPEISSEIYTSDPVEALVAATGLAALTVVRARGSGGFPGLRIGSVGLRLAAHCQGPMTVVPEDAAPDDTRDEIVLGVAANEPAEPISFAFDMAEELGTALRGVHAWQPIPPYNGYYYIEPSTLAAAAEDLLAAALSPARRTHSATRVTTDAVCATPAAALIDAGHGARVLVLGAHRRRTPLSIGIGPVLHAVLAHAPCPVAVVPLHRVRTERPCR